MKLSIEQPMAQIASRSAEQTAGQPSAGTVVLLFLKNKIRRHGLKYENGVVEAAVCSFFASILDTRFMQEHYRPAAVGMIHWRQVHRNLVWSFLASSEMYVFADQLGCHQSWRSTGPRCSALKILR